MNKAHPPTFTWSLKDTLDDLETRFPKSSTDPFIIISISEQKLALIENKQVKKTYTISSAKAGTGNLSGSYKTPLGIHFISHKIGENAELGTIFKARIDTHKIAKILTGSNQKSGADNITSHILWLDGMEDGVNKGGNVDSHNRFIYIHGTDEEGRLGTPVSHGCIRMGNLDVVELFGLVLVGCLVVIIE
ncbi:MAG: L,D-transpeptidase [Cocleimonas sp.]|nr:L,D-transpeptidase [Cocleimonas sp.]